MWLQLKQTLQFQLCDIPDLVLLWERPCVLLLLMKCLPFLTFLHVLGHIGHVISSSFYNSTPTVVLLRYFFPSFSPNKWHQFSCWSATALWSAAVLFFFGYFRLCRLCKGRGCFFLFSLSAFTWVWYFQELWSRNVLCWCPNSCFALDIMSWPGWICLVVWT